MTAQTIIIFTLIIPLSSALVGYDCGSQAMNVTTISLVDVGECKFPEEEVNVTRRYIQLLQINDYTETTVLQCKLEVHRTVYYCGMHSHVSVVQNGEAEYLYDVTDNTCRNMHNTGTLMFGNMHTIQGLRVNSTTTRSMTFAGSIGVGGACNGGTFSDPYGSWDSVVVQGTLKITLTSYTARVSLDQNQIHMRSGVACPLADGSCIDTEGGHTFWRPIPEDSCNFKQYGILYEGYANKLIDIHMDALQTVYSLTTNDVTFALSAKGRESVCGYMIVKTEHPKLVIFETVKGETFALDKKMSVSNLDIFAYVNSKFVYVEKHIRSQLKYLYRDVVIQRCNLERQTLKNSLSIATQSPDEFAYNFMHGPGYMAVMAGEVAHLIKCVPVEVKIKHVDACYSELPVMWKNETYYLTPRTHILKSRGTEVMCNSFLPAYYQISNSWYKLMPKPVESLPPLTIKPLTKPTWHYANPSELATSGIYSEKDLKELRARIMFPVERSALLNDVAREMHGQPVHTNDGTLSKLLNEDALSRIAESAWTKMWTKFMTFGTVSAGIISIMMIFQLLKTAVGIVVRGYTLHTVFGWSKYMLGAVWTSLTHLMLYLGQGREQQPTREGVVRYQDRDVEAAGEIAPLAPEEEKLEKNQKNLYPQDIVTMETAGGSKPFFNLQH